MTPCLRCKTTEATVTTYWGDALCRPCAVTVAELLEATDRWPPVPWTDEDRELIP